MGWQVLEILETQEWETRPASSLERSHLHLTLRWERNLLLRGSCRFLEAKQKKGQNLVNETKKKQKKKQSDLGIHSPTLGDQAP